MPFKISIRVGDIVFEDNVETAEAALEKANVWADARLGEVMITLDGNGFTRAEFAAILLDQSFGD